MEAQKIAENVNIDIKDFKNIKDFLKMKKLTSQL